MTFIENMPDCIRDSDNVCQFSESKFQEIHFNKFIPNSSRVPLDNTFVVSSTDKLEEHQKRPIYRVSTPSSYDIDKKPIKANDLAIIEVKIFSYFRVNISVSCDSASYIRSTPPPPL